MRYEYIEPIVAAAKKVLEQVTSGEVTSGDVALVKGDDLDSDVSVLISVKGDSEGSIVICLDTATATALCEVMNHDMCGALSNGVCENPSLAMDTIAELSNMIAGNATSSLNELGFDFTVFPPNALVARPELVRKMSGLELFRVPLGTRCGEIAVNVALTTN